MTDVQNPQEEQKAPTTAEAVPTEAAPTEAAPAEAAPAEEEHPPEEKKDPSIVGELNAGEQLKFTNFQQHQNNALAELGQGFLQCLRIAGAFDQNKIKIKEVLGEMLRGKGLNPESTEWQYQVLNDGKIRGIRYPNAPAPDPAAMEKAQAAAKVKELDAAREKVNAQVKEIDAALADAMAKANGAAPTG